MISSLSLNSRTIWCHSELDDIILNTITQNSTSSNTAWRHSESNDVILHRISKTPYRMTSHKSRMTSSKILHLINIISQCRMTSHRVVWHHLDENLTILPTKSYDVTQNCMATPQSNDVTQSRMTSSRITKPYHPTHTTVWCHTELYHVTPCWMTSNKRHT